MCLISRNRILDDPGVVGTRELADNDHLAQLAKKARKKALQEHSLWCHVGTRIAFKLAREMQLPGRPMANDIVLC